MLTFARLCLRLTIQNYEIFTEIREEINKNISVTYKAKYVLLTLAFVVVYLFICTRADMKMR